MNAKKCNCGAITVIDGKESWSMSEELFDKHFPNLEIDEGTWSNCNHCVNHWGIDLCNCGSGEKVGECEGELEDCINNIPAQELGESKNYALWN